ncbi:TetR/AcrR family transcriptional regulator [Pedobacter sp.]|jgi:AcrR family transcriptional regulator|uniref:TetR/AcrR family transcriptional regulator n=1 Tax=Pedobacter sp. TaxID=1411316 RepID=UPI002D1C1811|nr:TetR/AcrR family transcriptional regulator [Pedobacter sp.]HWW38837.1 TetR/AcrR family transcriptional regulator [Pedobacter sp.]
MARKVYDGIHKNKERTKLKFIEAVGKIIREEGYAGLKLKKIVDTAGVDRKLLYHYFGSIDNLVETYVRQKDYYADFDRNVNELLRSVKGEYSTDLIKGVMHEHLHSFSKDVDMQQAILWHLNGGNPAINDVYEQREKIGGIFLDLAEPNFAAVDIDIKARIAIIVTGIYFMVLNKKSLICGIDLKTTEGIARIRNEISNIIEEAGLRLEKQKKI